MALHDEPIDWSANTLDSRDIEGRVAYLDDELNNYDFEVEEGITPTTFDADEIAEMREELTKLREFTAYATGYSGDWNSGATLIADDYFVTYAKEYAEGVGAIDDEARWPNNFIDWDAAADDLRTEYTAVEDPEGNTWWVR